MTLSTPQRIQTDIWVKATWEEFVAAMDDPSYEEGSGYFDNSYMRIEMAALVAGHGRHNSVVSKIVSLFAMVRNLRMAEFTNCSFRKTDVRGCQPDTAFYIGSTFQLPPQDNAPIDVEVFGPPTLAIEIGASSFKDDLGSKRLLYERLGVQEYWVVDVATRRVIAFSVAEGRSGQISSSEVLAGLEIALVEEALTRSQTDDDGAIMRWLMEALT